MRVRTQFDVAAISRLWFYDTKAGRSVFLCSTMFFEDRSELNILTMVGVTKPMFKLPSGGPNGLGE